MFTSRKFTLPDEEYKRIQEWAKNHQHTKFNDGVIGVTFIPTAIGTCIVGCCRVCKEEINVTNFDKF